MKKKLKTWSVSHLVHQLFLSLALLSLSPLSATEEGEATEQLWEEPVVEEEIHKLYLKKSEWKELLTNDQYTILREKGTEPAYTGKYNYWKEAGTYQCAACFLPLFSSKAKFDSGTGWPSFWSPLESDNIILEEDNTLFMKRTEVLCYRCESHLGHLFDDGPPPTGLRYCINSLALFFVSDDQKNIHPTKERGIMDKDEIELRKQVIKAQRVQKTLEGLYEQFQGLKFSDKDIKDFEKYLKSKEEEFTDEELEEFTTNLEKNGNITKKQKEEILGNFGKKDKKGN